MWPKIDRAIPAILHRKLTRDCFNRVSKLSNSGRPKGRWRRILYHSDLTEQGWTSPNRACVTCITSMNPEHMEIVNRGANAVDEWRSENPVERLDLSGADLSGAQFAGWNLGRAILDRADLSNADLSGTDLSEASLKKANLRNANLFKAMLYRTTLSGADLSGADVRKANMYRAVLRDCNIEGAQFKAAHTLKAIWPKGSGTVEGHRSAKESGKQA